MNQNGHSIDPNHSVRSTTPASEWGKGRREGYIIILPSGNKATLRNVALDQLIRRGEIPDFLTPVAARSLWSDTEQSDIAEDQDLNIKFLQLMDLIVPLSMVKPAVVEEPSPGKEEIRLDDVDFYDKVAIFNLAIQSSNVLRTFCEQQEKSLATIPDSEDNELQTELSDGN